MFKNSLSLLFFTFIFFVLSYTSANAQPIEDQKYASIDDYAARVDGATIEEVTRKLIAPYKSKGQKFRALFRWVTLNIEYDVEGYLGESKMIFDPDQVFTKRRGVCSGYSRLLQQMCTIAGIECVGVTGMARYDACDTTYDANHQWVAVNLDRWRLADPTWAAGGVNLENKTFQRKFDPFYYFPDPALFILTHFPEESKWQLLDHPLSEASFLNQVFLTPTFIEKGYELITPTRQDTCFQNILRVIVKGTRPALSYYAPEIDQHDEVNEEEVVAYDNGDGTFTIELTTAKNAYCSFNIVTPQLTAVEENSLHYVNKSLIHLRAFGYNDQLSATFQELNLKTCKEKIAYYLTSQAHTP